MPSLIGAMPEGDDESNGGSNPERRRVPGLLCDAFDCPSCGAYAHQTWEKLYHSSTSGPGFTPIEWSDKGNALWQCAHCSRCNRPSVWRGEQMVYPLKRLGVQAHKDMPDDLHELYDEAVTVAAVSRRAGAALARALVERLIKHLDTEAKTGDDLNTRIERLQGRVSSDLRTMLHVVRVTGNDVLHHKDQPGELAVMVIDDTEGPELVEYLLETANDLVDELISRPRSTARLRGKLPESIRNRLGL